MATEVIARTDQQAVGRPSALTGRVADDICQRLRSGSPKGHAARSVGIGESTLLLWLQWGRAARVCDVVGCAAGHHGPYRTQPAEPGITYLEFLEAVERAESDAVILAQTTWSAAWKGDWRAAMAWLQARHPAEYKPKDRVELTGADGGPLEVALTARGRLIDMIEAARRRMVGAEPDALTPGPPVTDRGAPGDVGRPE